MHWPATLKSLAERLFRHGNMLLYAGSDLEPQAATLVTQFVVLRHIKPEFVGIWSAGAVIDNYLLFTPLGVVNAMNREYPYFLGSGEETKADGVVRTASAYLYPKLTARYARDKIPVGRTALRAALWSMLFLLPVVLAGMVVVPWLIEAVLPRYVEAIPAARVALVASLFECMSIAALTFATTRAWRLLFMYTGAGLVVRFIGGFGGYMLLDDRLLGVAVGMVGASAVMAVITWLTVRMATPSDSRDNNGRRDP